MIGNQSVTYFFHTDGHTAEASMHSPNSKPCYDYEIYISATPDRVWNALSDGDITQHYAFGTRFTGKLAIGESYAFLGEHDFRAVEGEVLEVTPTKRLAMTWHARWDAAVEQDPPSRVTYELATVAPELTRLRVTHDQFDSENATYKGSVGSWPLMLSTLKSLLESARPTVAT
jgi:uncharacterized protein YndB with AHSA1/START domain